MIFMTSIDQRSVAIAISGELAKIYGDGPIVLKTGLTGLWITASRKFEIIIWH
jgi:hypothetical protein